MKKIIPLLFFFYAMHIFNMQAQSLPTSPVFMPYCDATLWPLYDIQKTDSTKTCTYVLAFVVDDQTKAGANPCWGGYATYDTSHFQSQIKQNLNRLIL